MEFCSSCGILLPIEQVGRSFCRPCSNIKDARCIDHGCQCSYCYNPNTSSKCVKSVGGSKNDFKQSESHPNSKKKKVKETQKKKKRIETQIQQNCTPQNDSFNKSVNEGKWDDKTNEAPSSPHFNEINDWNTMEEQHLLWDSCMDWNTIDDSTDVISDGWSQAVSNDWIEVARKDSSKKQMFGKEEFPVLKRGLKLNDVEEGIKADWEKQQQYFKEKLITIDASGIARLASGKRRKSNGKRYYIGGVDISFIKNNAVDACACLSVVRMPDLELVYQAMEMVQLKQMYLPGFLAFREVPFLISLFNNLKRDAPQYVPDVIMVDGNGILHPRGFGLASHLGVLLDVPTIGVAKTLISAQGIVDDATHKIKKQDLNDAGDGFDLISDSGQILGKCVRVHDEAPNPIYVSIGHKISLKSAVWIVLECSKYRIPEPVRRADLDSREYIRQGKTEPDVFILK